MLLIDHCQSGIYCYICGVKNNLINTACFIKNGKYLHISIIILTFAADFKSVQNMGKMLDSLKQYFENTPQEQLDKDWEEMKHLNDIGPDALEYAEKVRVMLEKKEEQLT